MYMPVLFLILTLTMLLNTPDAYAQEGQFSVGILPPILEINADPPAKIESIISVHNLNDNSRDLNIVFRSFRPSDQKNGQIEYLAENKIEGPDPLILQKIGIYEGERQVSKISLGPFETKELKMKISIEPGAPIGDYYFSIIFISQAESLGSFSQSILPGGIGTNVILSVGKKGETRGEMVKFSSPFFLGSGPVPFTLLLRNNSEHFIVPRGRIMIKNMFGKDAGKLEILPQYILSNSERYMRDTNQATSSAQTSQTLLWPEKFLLGIYTAKAFVKLSENGPNFETSLTFVALPLYIIFAISFFAFILLGIYLRVRKRL